jgi:hypothetical protein
MLARVAEGKKTLQSKTGGALTFDPLSLFQTTTYQTYWSKL